MLPVKITVRFVHSMIFYGLPKWFSWIRDELVEKSWVLLATWFDKIQYSFYLLKELNMSVQDLPLFKNRTKKTHVFKIYYILAWNNMEAIVRVFSSSVFSFSSRPGFMYFYDFRQKTSDRVTSTKRKKTFNNTQKNVSFRHQQKQLYNSLDIM